MRLYAAIAKHKDLLFYSVGLAAILFLLRLLELKYLVFTHGLEIYAAILALIFMALGVWIATRLLRTHTMETPQVQSESQPDAASSTSIGLTKRELEVLSLMAQGKSNAEIADVLFVSVNTVKTHGARLYEKLEVRRRTQAIEKARRLGMIS